MSSLGLVSQEQIRLGQQLAAWLTYFPVWGLRGVSSFQLLLPYYRWEPNIGRPAPPNTPVTHGAHCRRKSRPEPDLVRAGVPGVETVQVGDTVCPAEWIFQVGNTREIWWQVLDTASWSGHCRGKEVSISRLGNNPRCEKCSLVQRKTHSRCIFD